jgi:hypothetical protein
VVSFSDTVLALLLSVASNTQPRVHFNVPEYSCPILSSVRPVEGEPDQKKGNGEAPNLGSVKGFVIEFGSSGSVYTRVVYAGNRYCRFSDHVVISDYHVVISDYIMLRASVVSEILSLCSQFTMGPRAHNVQPGSPRRARI